MKPAEPANPAVHPRCVVRPSPPPEALFGPACEHLPDAQCAAVLTRMAEIFDEQAALTRN